MEAWVRRWVWVGEEGTKGTGERNIMDPFSSAHSISIPSPYP